MTTPIIENALKREAMFSENTDNFRKQKAAKKAAPAPTPVVEAVAPPPVPVPVVPLDASRGYERLAIAVCNLPGFAAAPSEGLWLQATYRVDNKHGVVKHLDTFTGNVPWADWYAHCRLFVRRLDTNIPDLAGLDMSTNDGLEGLHNYSDDLFEWVTREGYVLAKENAIAPNSVRG